MKKIRILHVAQAAGGVDRYIRMLLKYLDKEKFENILVCSQDFHEEDYRGLVDSFEQVEMTRAVGGNDLKAIRGVRALIKKYNPDIVYAHSSKAGAIARIADIGLKNYCVYNPHGWAFNMRCSAKKKAIYTMIEKLQHRSAIKSSAFQMQKNSQHWIRKYAKRISCKSFLTVWISRPMKVWRMVLLREKT